MIAALPVQAQTSAEVSRGLVWLQSQVQPDGALITESVSIATALQARSEALVTLKMLAAPASSITPLQAALIGDSDPSTEYLARRAWALKYNGIDQAALVEQLQQRQNSSALDGGYGINIAYASHALDTSFVLLAQKEANAPDTTTVANALAYLDAIQSADGSYGANRQTRLYVTVNALLAAAAWAGQTSTIAITGPAQQWLLAHRNASQHFGNSLDNALGLWALVGQTSQSAILQPLVDALKADQLPNGSWNNDPYVSAIALRALFLVTQSLPTPTTAAIHGLLIDASNSAPLANVTVQIVSGTPASTNSNANGSFGFASVVPGTVTLRFSKLGYASQERTVTLAAGQSLSLGTIALSQTALTASLSGVITNQAGTALPNVIVSVGTASVQTDATGAYQLTGLSPGEATITASLFNYQPATAAVTFLAGTSYAFSPRLVAKGSPQPSTALLTGVVVDANTKLALDGANVQLGAASQMTGASGTFTFNAITTGPFALSVSANGYQSLTVSGVTVLGVNNLGNIELARLPSSSSLTGTVKDAVTQLPINGASVSVQGQGSVAVTGVDGKYNISGLTGTIFTLNVAATGYLPQAQSVSLSKMGAAVVDVALSAQSTVPPPSDISFIKVATLSSAYPASGLIPLELLLANSASSSASVQVFALVIDSNNSVVHEYLASPLVGWMGKTYGNNPVTIAANSTLELHLDWNALRLPAGAYAIKARAVDESQRVLAEGEAGFTVAEAASLAGGVAADPPLAQAGASTPVLLMGDLTNTGNITLPPGDLQVRVTLETPDATESQQIKTSLRTFSIGSPMQNSRKLVADTQGNLYTYNASDSKIIKIDSAGAQSIFAMLPTNSFPNNLAIDGQGNLWVAVQTAVKLYKINPLGTISPFSITALTAIHAVDFSNSGTMYLTGTFNGIENNVSVPTETRLVQLDANGVESVLWRNGLIGPVALVKDNAGNFVVTNSGDGTLVKVSAIDGVISPFAAGLKRPMGITADAIGNFYVADAGANSIVKVSPIGQTSVYATGFNQPYDLKFDGTGNLFVSNAGNDSILKVLPNGTVLLFAKGIANGPQGMKYDANGNLWIANTDGTLRKKDVQDNVSIVATGLSSPRGVAIAGNGDVLVVESSSGTVSRFSNGVKSAFAGGLQNPYGVAVDAAGVVYVSEQTANRIARFDSAGNKIGITESVLSGPSLLQATPNGDVYIQNSGFLSLRSGGTVQIVRRNFSYSPWLPDSANGSFVALSGNSVLRVSANGTESTIKAGLGFSPSGLARDIAGNIILQDSANKKLHKLDAGGSLSEYATLPDNPRDLRSDPAGTVIVRLNNGAFYRIGVTGTLSPIIHSVAESIAGWSAGAGGQLIAWTATKTYRIDAASGATVVWLAGRGSNVSGAAVDGSGNLVLSDANMQNLSVYSDAGIELSQLDGFVRPADIVWTGSELRFTDNGNRLYGFAGSSIYPARKPGTFPVKYLAQDGADTLGTASTNSVYKWTGAVGTGFDTVASIGGFLAGIAVKGDGNVAVAVSGSSRVVILDAAKTIVKDYAGLSLPQGIAFDAAGRLYVANQAGGTIARFDSLTSALANTFATESSPQDLAFDTAGQLLVTKANNGVNRYGSDGIATTVTAGGLYKGVLVDGTAVLVVDSTNGQVRKLRTSEGVNIWDVFASGIEQSNAVRALANGDVAVLNRGTNTLVKYRAGKLDTLALLPAGMNAMAVAPDGDLTVVGNAGLAYRVTLDGTVKDLRVNALVDQLPLWGAAEASNGKLYTLGVNGEGNATVFEATVGQAAPQPSPGTVAYQTTRVMDAMPANGSYTHFEFGTWIPQYGGDFKIEMWRDGIDGKAVNFIHVGPGAQSMLTAAKSDVPPGDSSLAMCLDVKGADFTAISRIEMSQIRHVSKSGFPNGMAGDRAGEVYVTDTTSLYKTSSSGQNTLIAGGMTLSLGLATDTQQNFYVTSKNASTGRYQLIRISLQGVKTIVADLGVTSANGVAVNSKDEVLVGSPGKLLKVDKHGVVTVVATDGIPRPRGIAIDSRDNVYVQNERHFVSMIKPDGTVVTIFSKGDGIIDPAFEGDGYPAIATDCADNLYISPSDWTKVNQRSANNLPTEEHSLTQIMSRTGQVALLLDTLKIDPSLTDIDFLAFDRFTSRILMWNHGDTRIWQVPVTCGAIGVEAHLLAKSGQALTSATKPASATIPLADGRTEYVWSLRDVTAQGSQICFDASQLDVKLGEERKAIDSGFISFQNSFTSGDVKVPLAIPLVRAANLVNLSVTTDQVDYPADATAQISTILNNTNNTVVSGTLNVQVFDSHDVLIGNVTQQAVTLPANGTLPVLAPFSIGNIIPAQYTLKAVLSGAGVDLARAQATFNVLPDNSTASAKSTVVTDKMKYNASDRVVITSRVTSHSANIILDNLTIMVKVFNAANELQFSHGHTVPQLTPGTLRDYAITQTLSNVPEGIYTVKQILTDNQGRMFDQPQTTYTVGSTANTGFGLTGSISATPKPVHLGESLTLNFRTNNAGNSALSNLPLKVSIVNPVSQQVIAEFPYTANINAGANYQATTTWQATGVVGSTYVAVLSATVGGNSLSLAQDSFQLAAPITSDVNISLSTSITSPQFGDALTFTITAGNAGPASALGVSVTNALPAGLTFVSATASVGSFNSSTGIWTVGNLTNGATATLSVNVTVASTALMTNVVSITCGTADPNSANNSASVILTPIKLVGTIAASPKPGNVDETMLFVGAVNNQGAADLTGMPLSLTVSSAATQAVAQQWSFGPTIAKGNAFNLAQNWSTSMVNPGDYVVSLAATLAGKTTALAQDTFTLIQPVKLDIKQTLANGSRVLVLVSCKDGESETISSDGKPPVCITTRTQIIDQALTALGVTHTITTSEAAFRLAFRGGLYNTYWISGKEDKLHDDLAAEIREAVFAGDGFILDGEHDQRNKTLDTIVGLTWRGKIGETELPVDISGPFFGSQTLSTVGRALKIELAGSVQQAAFHGSKPNSRGPAVISNTYGSGRAVAFAFDLPFSLQAQAKWQPILGASLQAVLPAQSSTLTPDGLLSVKTSIANQAKATDVEMKSILPAGADYLSSNPAGIYTEATRTSVWAFNLAEAQTKDVFLLLQAATTAGNSNLQTTVATIRNGTATPYGNPLTLPITVVTAVQSSAVASSTLQALILTQTKDNKLRDALLADLQVAMSNFNKNTVIGYQTAIGQLLSITERLSGLPGDTSAVRLGIDRILKEAQWRWVLAQPPGTP